MKKIIYQVTSIAIALILVFSVYPVDSAHASIEPAARRPRYTQEIEYILNSNCKAIGWTPYEGLTYYSCPSGDRFWSSMMVNIEGSPLFTYSRKRLDDEETQREIAMQSNNY